MVFIEGKEVIFHNVFLANHSEQVIVHAPLGNSPINFRFTFGPVSQDGGMSWQVEPNGLVQVVLTPAAGLGSASPAPARLGQASDGGIMYVSYTQQAMNDASLINLFILKGPAATAAPSA